LENMSRMNKRTRDRLYPILAERQYGEYCKVCGEPGTKETLIIEHLDNNNANNELENLRLCCQSCNILKNPRGKGQKKISPESASAREINIESTKSAAQAKNDVSEPVFRRWVYSFMLVHGKISVQDAINSGAEVARCSTQASKRYVDKMASITGDYQIGPGKTDKERMLMFKDEVDPDKLKEKSKAEALKALEEKFAGESEKKIKSASTPLSATEEGKAA
jgi:hypothetical protein